jgi:hypothetical protein
MALIMYVLAVTVMVSAVIRFKWFSFVLTDKSISVNSGAIFQKSTTFRFDKIQDIDTRRGPLSKWLELKSVAIWTASLDQRAGNKKKPDGSILLDADTADWLINYLSDPTVAASPTTAASANSAALGNRRQAPPALPPGSTTNLPANSGFVLTLVVAALISLTVVLQVFWKNKTVTRPYTVSAPAAAPVPRHRAARNPVQSPAAAPALNAKSMTADHPTTVQFVNNAGVPVEVYWRDYQGSERLYQTLQPGQSYLQSTFATHPWVARDATTHRVLASLIADVDAQNLVVSALMQNDPP